jgi:hypothetical protein
MGGLRSSGRANQGFCGAPWRSAQRTTAIAPVISRRRMSRWPIFEVFPNRCLPPVEARRGTSPSHAAKSRPRLNWSIGGAKVSTARAPIGPTPGMVCKRRDVAPSLAITSILFFMALIRPVRWEDLIQQLATDLPGEPRQGRVGVLDDHSEARQIADPLGRNVAELVQVGPQGVDRFGALLHELLAGPKQDGPRLLLPRLRLDEAHGWSQRRLRDRLRVRGVVLLWLPPLVQEALSAMAG